MIASADGAMIDTARDGTDDDEEYGTLPDETCTNEDADFSTSSMFSGAVIDFIQNWARSASDALRRAMSDHAVFPTTTTDVIAKSVHDNLSAKE